MMSFMIDQTAFELCAAQLAGVVCPDCGGTHGVSVKFDDRGVVVWSVDESGQSSEGFKDLVNKRLSMCNSREQKRKAVFLLRRALGDPSL